MRQDWLPSRQLIVAQGIVTLVVAAGAGVLARIDGFPWSVVIILALLTVLIALSTSAVFEHMRRPFRVHALDGKSLMDMLDNWLRDGGYTRGPSNWIGYSHAILASVSDESNTVRSKVWIGKQDSDNKLVLASYRSESPADTQTFETFSPAAWTDLQYEIAIELSRFGVDYNITQTPLSIIVWDFLTVDSTFTEAKFLERVLFIQRADYLVELVVRKAAASVVLSQPTTPPIVDFGHGSANGSGGGGISGGK